MKGTPMERFMHAFVADEVTGCWNWQHILPKGYGRLRVDGRLLKAHRWAYEQFVGPIPDGLTLDHLCRNRGCVNPDHLEPVTAEENSRRGLVGIIVAPDSYCRRGLHPFDEANTAYSEGRRRCRACHAANNLRYYWRDKQLLASQEQQCPA